MTITAAAITSRPAAAAHLTRVCFKLGPPRLVGAELEWFTHVRPTMSLPAPSAPVPPTLACPVPARPTLAALGAALGPHAPRTVVPDSPAHPLRSGSLVSVEPGGQVELSSPPLPDVPSLRAALADDERHLRSLLEPAGVALVGGAADGARAPHRILTSPRYTSMETAFARRGIFGALMMCNTAAVQVAVDAGVDADHAVARWTRLHTIGPAMLAAFACSPRLYGADDQQWVSQRMRAWLGTDRTRIPPPAQTIDDYADWVLSVPLLCVRDRTEIDESGSWVVPPADATFGDWMDGHLDDVVSRRPDANDLAYHVGTVFPMVRPQGHMEVRYLDGQPDGRWSVPIAAIAALMSDDAVGADADRIARPTADAWRCAARVGLADGDLRRAATELLTLAADTLPRGADRDDVAAAADRCRRGLSPLASDDSTAPTVRHDEKATRP